jgi:hypothetical protein
VVKEVISRCNICGSVDGVEEFTITRAGTPKVVDACAEHGAPLIALYDPGETPQKAAPRQRGGADRRSGGSRHSIVPIEDWKEGKS